MDSSPHKLDPARLQVLARQRDDALGAARKIEEECSDLVRERIALQREVPRLEQQRAENYTIRREDIARKTEEVDRAVAEINRKLADLNASKEAASEKWNAAARLYQTCAETLGVSQ